MTTLHTPAPSADLPGADSAESLLAATRVYLARCQEKKAGAYFGAFWSEKAYHGPALDFHAGGAHHHRGAGSAALALQLTGQAEAMRQAEWGFDWLISRQRPSGGFLEIQNNDRPSDWEQTGREECSTIATAFAMRGLAGALLHGLPPKPLYERSLIDAGLWQIGLENPPSSGIFPHHERSAGDCLNANLHAAEMLVFAYRALRDIYGRDIAIFLQAAERAVAHTLPLQQPEGHFPYRRGGGVTLNYTAIVGWCLLNLVEVAPPTFGSQNILWRPAMARAAAFLRAAFDPQRGLDWETFETSTARHNMHTYLLIYNILKRMGGEANERTGAQILTFLLERRTPSGLLPVKDTGEVITECLPMQADMALCLRGLDGSALRPLASSSSE